MKGQNPVEVVNWVTRHGPLFVSEGNDRMSLRWTFERGVLGLPIGMAVGRIGDIVNGEHWATACSGVAHRLRKLSRSAIPFAGSVASRRRGDDRMCRVRDRES